MASNDGPSASPQDGPSASPQEVPSASPQDGPSASHSNDGPSASPQEPLLNATLEKTQPPAGMHVLTTAPYPASPQERLLHETLEKTHAAAAARAAAREAAFKSQLPDQTAHELSVSERSLAAAQVRDTDGR